LFTFSPVVCCVISVKMCRVPPVRVYTVRQKSIHQIFLAIFPQRNKILHAHIVFISMQKFIQLSLTLARLFQ